MDAALLRKINIYPTGAGRPGLEKGADFTHANVIEADASMFHGDATAEPEDASDVLPEPDYDEGFKDGQAKSDLMYQNTINVMQQTLAALQAELSQVTKQIEQQHLFTVQSCLNSIFPTLMALGSGQELLALISEITQQGVTGKIQFVVHPDAREDCERLCELQAGDFSVITDETLTPLQVRVLWEQGGAEIDCESAVESLQQKLGEALQSLKHGGS